MDCRKKIKKETGVTKTPGKRKTLQKFFLSMAVVVFVIAYTGCESDYFVRDKLRGESEVLIGSWTWIYSTKQIGIEDSDGKCDYWDAPITVFPVAAGYTCDIAFEQRGVALFYFDGILTEEYDIHFDYFDPDGYHYFDFSMALDKDPVNKTLRGDIKGDTLEIGLVPFQNGIEICTKYVNYFVKKQ